MASHSVHFSLSHLCGFLHVFLTYLNAGFPSTSQSGRAQPRQYISSDSRNPTRSQIRSSTATTQVSPDMDCDVKEKNPARSKICSSPQDCDHKMMFLFAVLSLTRTPTVFAAPLSHHQKHTKRSRISQNVGSGFAIAICILLLATVFYYLGMRHERTKSYFSKHNALKAEIINGPGAVTEKRKHTRQISCPLAVSSSAPIKPYDEAIEAPAPSLRYYEMPVQELHEMGLPSPKKAPPRASWRSLDCKPWWLKHTEHKQQSSNARTVRCKSMPNWFKSAKTIARKKGNGMSSELGHEFNLDGRSDLEYMGRASEESIMSDWSGLEQIRKLYAGRKSRIIL